MTTMTSTRPGPDEHAAFYANYIRLVPDGDALSLLDQQRKDTKKLLGAISEAKATYRYAPDKWSIRGVVGHVTDSERVFAYRALSIGRGDPNPLPGFDEKTWAQASGSDDRTLKDLVKEYDLVRGATVALFRSLSDEAWTRRGTANNNPVSVRALCWIILGHERHHVRILQERYLAG